MILLIVSLSLILAVGVGIIFAHAKPIQYCPNCGYLYPKGSSARKCPVCGTYERAETSGL